MDHIDALSEIFDPGEEVTITLNDEPIFSGPFEEAVPMLEQLDIGENDHLVVSNDEVGPLAPMLDYFSMN